jgi:hypothetical protein
MGLFSKKQNITLSDFTITKGRNAAKDHILYMLGAPVLKIELDDAQVEHAIDVAHEQIYGKYYDNEYLIFLKDGALAYAKYMLGRLRSKYDAEHGPSDGRSLVSEAISDISTFKYKIK